jgi:hypothetical protein
MIDIGNVIAAYDLHGFTDSLRSFYSTALGNQSAKYPDAVIKKLTV